MQAAPPTASRFSRGHRGARSSRGNGTTRAVRVPGTVAGEGLLRAWPTVGLRKQGPVLLPLFKDDFPQERSKGSTELGDEEKEWINRG